MRAAARSPTTRGLSGTLTRAHTPAGRHTHTYSLTQAYTDAGYRRSAPCHRLLTDTKYGTALKGKCYCGGRMETVEKRGDTHTVARAGRQQQREEETVESTARCLRRPAYSASPHSPQHTRGSPAALAKRISSTWSLTHAQIVEGVKMHAHTGTPHKEHKGRECEHTVNVETQQTHTRRERRAARSITVAATLRGRGEKQLGPNTHRHTHTHTHTQGKINARTGRDTRATRGSSSRAAVKAAQAPALTHTAPPPQDTHHPFLNSWECTHKYTRVHALERASRRTRAAPYRRPWGETARGKSGSESGTRREETKSTCADAHHWNGSKAKGSNDTRETARYWEAHARAQRRGAKRGQRAHLSCPPATRTALLGGGECTA